MLMYTVTCARVMCSRRILYSPGCNANGLRRELYAAKIPWRATSIFEIEDGIDDFALNTGARSLPGLPALARGVYASCGDSNSGVEESLGSWKATRRFFAEGDWAISPLMVRACAPFEDVWVGGVIVRRILIKWLENVLMTLEFRMNHSLLYAIEFGSDCRL